jgi:uroporphyrinogen-III decarboxylase
MERKSEEAAEIILNSPVEIIMIGENISSDMIGKRYFEEYLKPYEEKWNRKIKEKGKYSLIHMDGMLKGLLSEVSSTKPSAIEALTPKPAGDLYIEEFRDYVKNEVIMWGGIPGVLFTPGIDDKFFESYVKNVIKIMESEPRYVLGIGDQIPPDGIIERVKIVSRLVEAYECGPDF